MITLCSGYHVVSFQTIKESFPEGEAKFEAVSEQCTLVLQNTSPTGCDRIQQEMKLLKDELSSLHEVAAEMISSLEVNMVGLEEYHAEHAQFTQWLDEVEDKVKVNAQQFDLHAPEQLEADLEVCVRVCVHAYMRACMYACY